MKTSVQIRDALFEPPGPKTRQWVRLATALVLVAVAFLLCAVIRRFYLSGQLEARLWSFFGRWTTWRFLLQGLGGTLAAAGCAGAVSFGLAFVLMLGRISRYRVPRAAASAVIQFTRGVPTLLFVYFFLLVLPQYGVTLPALWKISLPVALSAAGVVAEVLRSGLNAVPKGQREAAVSLGMRERSVFLKVLFPQAFRFVLPALIAELVIVVKDTTFAYVVNFPDLMQNASVLRSNYDALLPIYLFVTAIYILINYLINRASVWAATRARTG